jgi:diguanylate cyclase (GGDEF)-like protein
VVEPQLVRIDVVEPQLERRRLVKPQLVVADRSIGAPPNEGIPMTEQPPSVQPRVAAVRAWLLVVVLAAAAALGSLGLPAGPPRAPGVLTLSWPVLALLFVVAESCVVHLRFGGDAHSFALGDIPLVLGLFLATPDHLIVARLLGTLASLAWHRRQPILKLCFNLAMFSLGAAVAIRIWHALVGHSSAFGGRAWLAALVAVMATDVLTTVVISGMLALRRGRVEVSTVLTPLWTGLLSSGANTCVALVALDVLRVDWRGTWALLAVAALLGFAQRAYTGLTRRNNALEQLNTFVREVDVAQELQTGVADVLRVVREMLQAHVAAVEITDPTGELAAYWYDGDGLHEGAPAEPPSVPPSRSWRRWSWHANAGTSSLAVTLSVDAQPTGRLRVVGRLGDVGQFGPDDARLLNAIGNHAGIALRNGRLVDQLREQARLNAYQATHDALTDLPNRLSFERTLTDFLAAGQIAAVLLLDLDRFKEVNDTLGHAVGDQLLCEIGQRLRSAVPASACVARFGGDEFALLLPGADQAEALRHAAVVHVALSQPLRLRDVMLSADASVGIALAPDHGDDSESLLRHADAAMYAAKATHRNSAVYVPEADYHTASRLAMVGELKEAIAGDQLRLYYQPKAELRTGAVHSVEALVRWQHPARGLVPPDEFISLAEQTGLIGGLTDWVMHTALRQQRQWLDAGIDLKIAINVSPRLLDDESLPATVAALLDAHAVAADRVILEITENTVMTNPDHVIEVLDRLREVGITLSMGDFGIGHSSMAYLKKLPIDEVKIDKLFVQGMANDAADHAIVQAIVQLAHRLNLHVVAEGVETPTCWQELAVMGVDTAQGYLLSRPVPADDLAKWFLLRQSDRSEDIVTAAEQALRVASGGR